MHNHSACFYKTKYHSMLITGTFAMAMVYIMLLSSNIIAGLMIGKDAVAADMVYLRNSQAEFGENEIIQRVIRKVLREGRII